MPRIRTIKPQFWQDTRLSRLPALERLVFLCLISMADDEGRIEGDTETVTAFGFPREEPEAIGKAIQKLDELGRVAVYEVEDNPHIAVLNFEKHQYVAKRVASKIPAPPGSPAKAEPKPEAKAEKPAEPKPKKAKAPEEKPDPNTRQAFMFEKFKSLYEFYRKNTYPAAPARDCIIFAELLKSGFSEDDLVTRMHRFFKLPADKYPVNNGFTVPAFKTAFAGLEIAPRQGEQVRVPV